VFFATRHHCNLKYLHGQLGRLYSTKLQVKQYHFGFFSHAKFFRAEVMSELEYTRFSVLVAEVSLDIVLRRLE